MDEGETVDAHTVQENIEEVVPEETDAEDKIQQELVDAALARALQRGTRPKF